MSVEEEMGSAHVIHDVNNCDVCQGKVLVRHMKPVRQMCRIDKIIIGVVMLAIGFTIGIYIAWEPLPLARIYRDFNHIRIYEDGSYEAETRKGADIQGCIEGALCND